MAPKALLPLLLPCLMRTHLFEKFVSSVSTKSTGVNPFACSDCGKTCTSLLYQHNNLPNEKIASFYSVNESQITPISHGYEQIARKSTALRGRLSATSITQYIKCKTMNRLWMYPVRSIVGKLEKLDPMIQEKFLYILCVGARKKRLGLL